MFKAINGDEGGVWAPSSVITIGGSGIELGGNKLKLLSGTWPVVDAASLTNYSPLFTYSLGDSFDTHHDGYIKDNTTASTHYTYVFLKLPIGCTISSVGLGVRGSTGGMMVSTAAPDNRALVELVRFSPTDYATPAAVIGSQQDTSANNLAYTIDHQITISGLSHTVLENNHYALRVTIQPDANAAVGFRIYRPTLTGTISQLRVQ